jgi:hypothetical protein
MLFSKGGRIMSKLIKIMHIDPDYQTTYFIYRPGSSIRTSVPLSTAIALLKKDDFDLIISEPHNKAILRKQPLGESESGRPDAEPVKEAFHGDIGQIWSN